MTFIATYYDVPCIIAYANIRKSTVFLSDLAPVIQVPRSIGSGSRAHVEVSQSQGSARPVTLYTLKPEPILVCEREPVGVCTKYVGQEV